MRITLVLVWLSTTAVGCGEEGICEAGELASAVRGASAGDTVRVGACRVRAALELPAGVTLTGVSRRESVLVVDEGTIGIRMQDADGARVRSLTIESSGNLGVLGRGPGAIVMERVTVRARRGVGIGFDGTTDLTLRDVSVTGLVTMENADDGAFRNVRPRATILEGEICEMPSTECADGETRPATCAGCEALQQVCFCGLWHLVIATDGIALFGVRRALFEDVTVRGFAGGAVTVRDTTIAEEIVPASFVWNRGAAGDGIGVGLFVIGGVETTMDRIDLLHTWESARGAPPYAAFFLGGAARPARVASTSTRVVGNDRYGMFHVRTSGSHTDLTATENGDAAVWIRESTDFEIRGATVSDNALGGIVANGVDRLVIADATVERTIEGSIFLGGLRTLRVGDGIHLIDAVADTRLERVTLRDNAKVQLLVDLGAGMGEGLVFDTVMVDGTAMQLGAVGGATDAMGVLTAAPVGSWNDASITRLGATAANDAAAGLTADAAIVSTPDAAPRPPIIISPCD